MKIWKAGTISKATPPRILCRGLKRARNSCGRPWRHQHVRTPRGKYSLARSWGLGAALFCCYLPWFDFCSSNSESVDYEDSYLIVRYLASMRPFAQSFDIYLSQVGRFRFLIIAFYYIHSDPVTVSPVCSCVDSESAGWKRHRCQNQSHEVSVWSRRSGSQHPGKGKFTLTYSKKNRSLFKKNRPISYISSLDLRCPQVDMQRGVHGRLMDNSTSVREAAVELVGRFVLSRPELIEQYYDMLIERILVISYSSF